MIKLILTNTGDTIFINPSSLSVIRITSHGSAHILLTNQIEYEVELTSMDLLNLNKYMDLFIDTGR